MFVLLLAVPLLFSQGCSQPDSNIIRFGLSSSPLRLDPRFATDATSSRLNRLLYERLTDFDDASRAIPSLANWQQLSPLRYRFVLRPNRRSFNNGERLTSADVKTTYDFVLNKKNASPHRSSLVLIKYVRIIDPDTIEFELNHADALFPSYLVIGIVSEKAVQRGVNLDQHPAGSGPFTMRDWPEEGRLQLQRRRDKQVFEFVHIGDSTVRTLKLLRGEIDILQNDLPRELVNKLRQDDSVRVANRTGSNFSYLGFNFLQPQFADRRVRQAVMHAIDRKSLVRYVLGGKTRVAESILPPEHWAGNDAIKAYRFDPGQSRALLKQAGYDAEHPLRMSYKTSSDPFRIRIATIIQQQLADVGIKVELVSYDWATFYGDIKAGRFQLYSLSWVGIKSPDILRYVFHSKAVPPDGANRGHYNNPLVDRLIERAEREADMDKRAQLYRELLIILHDDLPYIPLWYEEHFSIVRKNIKGYQLTADGSYDYLSEVSRQN
ncbi:MAG TPA: ABC transporter substrate-binding protein [Gammaproteobacteria bacterium]|nr:ABC transporter substrate-binding protein [Gammaproteobacteria bacterium]